MPDFDLGNLLLCNATTNRSLTLIALQFAATDAFYFATKVIRSFGEKWNRQGREWVGKGVREYSINGL